jgi:ATP-binding cassette subfamily F protein uup
MSFKDKHELESLPARMTVVEEEIAALQARLADTEFYVRDPKGFAAASARLEKAQHVLAAAEERWLELETLRDGLARQ